MKDYKKITNQSSTDSFTSNTGLRNIASQTNSELSELHLEDIQIDVSALLATPPAFMWKK